MSDFQPDKLFSEEWNKTEKFRFDEKVAQVFDDMIRRSIPGYETLLRLIALVADEYAQPDSHLYDLGCSLGAVSLVMQQTVSATGCRIIAIDQSEAMSTRCQRLISSTNSRIPVDVRCGDVLNETLENASVVVMNFTLQFLSPDQRLQMIQKIYKGMKPGGVLILSEKLQFDSDSSQQFQTHLYEKFKRSMGYSDLEISQKRTALENVLITDTQDTHRKRLKDAGFQRTELLFQSLCFASFVSWK